MLFIYKHIFSVYVFVRLSASQNNQRLALVNLAKTLSENLETTIKQTSGQLTNLTSQTNKLNQDVVRLDGGLSECLKSQENLELKVEELEDKATILQDRRQIDQTIWNYNNLVCNASLESLRNDLELKISELSAGISSGKEEEINLQNQNITETNKTNVFSGTLNLLGDLSSILDDYQYYDDIDETQALEEPEPLTTNYVSTLIDETNLLLLHLNMSYKQLQSKLIEHELEISGMKEKMGNNDIKEDIIKQINKFQQDVGFRMSRIRSDVEQGDSDIRNEIKLKVEDIGLLKQITGSRLSVYESRLDLLEAMVLNISLASSQNMEQFLASNENQNISTSTTSTTTTEEPMSQFSMSNELDNLAANILNPTGSLPRLESSSSAPVSNQGYQAYQDYLPSKSQMDQWTRGYTAPKNQRIPVSNLGYQTQGQGAGYQGQGASNQGQGAAYQGQYSRGYQPQMPGGYPEYPGQQGQQQTQTVAERPRRRSGRTLPQREDHGEYEDDYADMDSDGECNCSDMKERMAILESGFENIMTEVESQMSGIQLSVTRMMHKIQDIEAKQLPANSMRTGCVASQKASDIEEMNAWCGKWCPQGMCPSELCSCPTL